MHPLDTSGFVVRLLAGLVAAALTWVFAIDAGDLVLFALRIPRAAPCRGIIAAALGYAILGTLAGIWGLAHISGPIIGVFIVAAALLVAFEHRKQAAGIPRLARAVVDRLREATPLDRAAICATTFAIVTAAVAASLPAVWWDPIAYHLPIVARVLAQHTFSFDPAMVQSGFPLLAEAAALPAYAIAGSAGAAMATLGAGIALAYLCGGFAESIAAGSGRLATALVACSALWLWIAPSFYVDVPFALFAVGALALAHLVGARATDWSGGAAAVGMLAGAAAATKYPGLFVGVLTLAILLCTGRSIRAKALLACAGGFAAIAAGWYVRTALLTGDPLYPLLAARGLVDPGVHDFAARYVAMTQTWCGGGTTLLDAVALPWRLLTNPNAFCGDAGYALDLGAIFVVVSLAAWRRAIVPLTAAAALTAVWFYSSQQWRFLLPAMCLFAVLAAVGVAVATQRIRAIVCTVLIVLCIVDVAVDWLPNPARDTSNSVAPGYGYIAGGQSGDDYLSARLETYDAARHLRAVLAKTHDPIAALDDVRDYYFGAGTVWLNPYYQSKYDLDWSAPPRQRYAPLVRAGMRYLVVNDNPLYVRRTPTGVDWNVLAADERSGVLTLTYSANDVKVYALPGTLVRVRQGHG